MSVLLFLFSLGSLFSQNHVYYYNDEGLGRDFPLKYYFEDNNGYLEILSDDIVGYLTDTQKALPFPNIEGLLYQRIYGRFTSQKYRDFTIIDLEGQEYLFLESDDHTVSVVIPLKESISSSREKRWFTFWGVNKKLYDAGIGITDGLSIISYSSALEESLNGEKIIYNNFPGKHVITQDSFWVEGQSGSGIGESISVNPGYSEAGFIFLNGFVAPWNKELYYENSRVKKIKMEYNGIEEIFDLKDSPNPQVFRFKRAPATQIRITLLDIFPGAKYQDTAISNILFLMKK
jgi:hypothetical protein